MDSGDNSHKCLDFRGWSVCLSIYNSRVEFSRARRKLRLPWVAQIVKNLSSMQRTQI